MYSVNGKDLLTAGEPNSVKEGDEVPFKYRSLRLTGIVKKVSTDEDEIIAAMKAEKKAAKKEASFHADQPRKCTLKPSDTKAIENKNPKELKAKEKKIQEAAKVKAKVTTEAGLLDNTTVSSEKLPSSPASSSSSSVEENAKDQRQQHEKDLKCLSKMDPPSDTSDPDSPLQSPPSPPQDNLKEGMSDNDNPSLANKEVVKVKRERSLSPTDGEGDQSDTHPVKKHHRSHDSGSGHKHVGLDSSSSSSDPSSSESSTSDSSSTSSSSSDESDSSSSSDNRKKRKKSNKRKKSKKSKKGKKSRKNKKSKKIKKKSRIERNKDIFPGKNYIYDENDEGVVRVHSNYSVYTNESKLQEALTTAMSPCVFIKSIVGHVYTPEALKGSTAQGFPSRHKGAKKLKQKDVLPGLDPAGRNAILKRAEDLESERKSWRPRIGSRAMAHAFTQAVGAYH